MHGFTDDGENFFEELVSRNVIDLNRTRVVSLTAPSRYVTVYRAWDRAWYDYLSDHASSGNPDQEESIGPLTKIRSTLLGIVDDEVSRLWGESRRVALLGHSQGGCVALDTALLYGRPLGGVFAGHAHVTSSTIDALHRRTSRIKDSAISTPVHAFHSISDDIIGWGMARKSYATLSQYLSNKVSISCACDVAHSHFCHEEDRAIREFLSSWRRERRWKT